MSGATGQRKDVKCAKCGCRNDPERDSCAECNASLYVDCGGCGLTNPRSYSRCTACGERLHRRFWRLRYRLQKLPLLRNGFNPLLVIGFLLVILILYKVVTWLANLG